MTQRYKAIISYDGTNYSGYQIQPNHLTIQEKLESAIFETCRQKVRVYSSGRTDRGVHARGQVIHFDLSHKLAPALLFRALNAVLPRDIRVESIRFARASFDARMSATGKEYRYFIWNAPALTPDIRLHRAHIRMPLNIAAMRAAAKKLEGKHDFAAFTANPRRPPATPGQPASLREALLAGVALRAGEVEGTVRHVRKLQVKKSGAEIVIVVRGDGFLYKMVRSLAGFLIRVGMGELTLEDATRILHSKTRTAAVPTADAQGLFLWRVFYGK